MIQRVSSQLIVMFIIILGLLFSCSNSKTITYKNIEEMLCKPKPTPPLSNKSQAICFAVHNNYVVNSLQKAQQKSKYDGWKIKVNENQKNNDGWSIQIQSKWGTIPSFKCDLTVKKNGKVKLHPQGCRYMK